MSTTSTEPHRPIRTCVGCRRRAPQDTLVRCAVAPDGGVRVDRTAPGRGAWVCSPECVATAMTRRGFDRAWRRSVPAAAFDGVPDAVQRALRAMPAVRSGSTRHERLTTRVKG